MLSLSLVCVHRFTEATLLTASDGFSLGIYMLAVIVRVMKTPAIYVIIYHCSILILDYLSNFASPLRFSF